MGKYEDWKDEYYNLEKVNLNKYLSKNNFETLEKLGIELEDKVYTESEFEELDLIVLSFYDENNDKPKKIIEEKNVSIEEYLDLIENLRKINEEFEF